MRLQLHLQDSAYTETNRGDLALAVGGAICSQVLLKNLPTLTRKRYWRFRPGCERLATAAALGGLLCDTLLLFCQKKKLQQENSKVPRLRGVDTSAINESTPGRGICWTPRQSTSHKTNRFRHFASGDRPAGAAAVSEIIGKSIPVSISMNDLVKASGIFLSAGCLLAAEAARRKNLSGGCEHLLQSCSVFGVVGAFFARVSLAGSQDPADPAAWTITRIVHDGRRWHGGRCHVCTTTAGGFCLMVMMFWVGELCILFTRGKRAYIKNLFGQKAGRAGPCLRTFHLDGYRSSDIIRRLLPGPPCLPNQQNAACL